MSDDGQALAHERTALLQAQRDARTTSKRGLLLLVFIPLVDLVAAVIVLSDLSAILAVFTFLLAAVFTGAAAIRGLALIAAGSLQYRKASTQLTSLEKRALPEARLIVR